MKKWVFAILAGLVLIGCQGPEGPMGPTGLSGSTGPAGKDGKDGGGANIVTYTGKVTDSMISYETSERLSLTSKLPSSPPRADAKIIYCAIIYYTTVASTGVSSSEAVVLPDIIYFRSNGNFVASREDAWWYAYYINCYENGSWKVTGRDYVVVVSYD